MARRRGQVDMSTITGRADIARSAILTWVRLQGDTPWIAPDKAQR